MLFLGSVCSPLDTRCVDLGNVDLDAFLGLGAPPVDISPLPSFDTFEALVHPLWLLAQTLAS